MCNLNVIAVLEFISRDLYLLFAICFSSKFQNSTFYQHMRPNSGLKSPRPFQPLAIFCACTAWFMLNLLQKHIDSFLMMRLKFCFSVKAFSDIVTAEVEGNSKGSSSNLSSKGSSSNLRSRANAGPSEGGEVPEKYYVVQNNEMIRVKYLLIYAQKTQTHR